MEPDINNRHWKINFSFIFFLASSFPPELPISFPFNVVALCTWIVSNIIFFLCYDKNDCQWFMNYIAHNFSELATKRITRKNLNQNERSLSEGDSNYCYCTLFVLVTWKLTKTAERKTETAQMVRLHSVACFANVVGWFG